MAKNKNVVDEINTPENVDNHVLNQAPELTPESITALEIARQEFEPHSLDAATVEGLFAEMEVKKTEALQELTANYLTFEGWAVGEERNYLFTKVTTFTKPETGEQMPACILMNKNRENFIVASKVVVGNLLKIDKDLPCAVRIKSNGKIKGANGSYYSVQVFTF